MTDDEIQRLMERAFRDLPPSGVLSDEDRKKFWEAIEIIIPHLPGDSRDADRVDATAPTEPKPVAP